ncbi:glycosyltransferase family 4 protein [Nocardioides dubius]|uniref:Glycosyltransferase subfamily 4-like N-terminal domain-containing protein n=1 Tax=Nocardioides dubius TaxID=317019 RepID=A0ABP4ES44_9ACTN
MKILVHDYSGHPFQVELSRELSQRGHDVTHSWCEAHVSGKGHLQAKPGEALRFSPVGVGEVIDKLSFGSRLVQELRYGVQLARQTRRLRPDVVLVGNVPIPMLVVFATFLMVARVPWVHWQQDVQSVAVRSFAGRQLSRAFVLVAAVIAAGERWCTRRARHTVVIADSFLDVHRRWGTEEKATVIPNWAPLDELVPTERDNRWAQEQGTAGVQTLLYSGTLGLKHNPALLVALASRVIAAGTPVQLCVVTEGPAGEVLRSEADRLGVPLRLLEFQPYERLSEVLGAGDVLLVLLEKDAGAFSVPSKTLSYLCAGRPVLGMMPGENLAAHLIDQASGCVVAPEESALDEAAEWVASVLADADHAAKIGALSRQLAEREFALAGCADQFERILTRVTGRLGDLVVRPRTSGDAVRGGVVRQPDEVTV